MVKGRILIHDITLKYTFQCIIVYKNANA